MPLTFGLSLWVPESEVRWVAPVILLELDLELIQTGMIQKPLLWVEVGKSAGVLVGICELRLSPPAR